MQRSLFLTLLAWISIVGGVLLIASALMLMGKVLFEGQVVMGSDTILTIILFALGPAMIFVGYMFALFGWKTYRRSAKARLKLEILYWIVSVGSVMWNVYRFADTWNLARYDATTGLVMGLATISLPTLFIALALHHRSIRQLCS